VLRHHGRGQICGGAQGRFAGLAFAAALTFGGCTSGLAFRASDDLQITGPVDGDVVSAPLDVTWTMEPRPAEVKGFAVYVDRNPQPPGKSIEYFRDDNRARIYVTESSDQLSLQIPAIEPRRGVASSVKNDHEIVVVPLDGDGRRIGEHVDRVGFEVFVEEDES
jgi:uncharacterized protein (DUF58 family)